MTRILYGGIDVSKNKLDVAIASCKDKIPASSTFENILKGINGFKSLEKWIKKHAKTFENVHFCVESTGIYHEEIVEFLQDKGFIVSIINPFQSKAFANSKLCRTKTDKVYDGLLAHWLIIA